MTKLQHCAPYSIRSCMRRDVKCRFMNEKVCKQVECDVRSSMRTRANIGNTSLSSIFYRMRLGIEVEMKLLHNHVGPDLMSCGP